MGFAERFHPFAHSLAGDWQANRRFVHPRLALPSPISATAKSGSASTFSASG
jgi:hypothetical protein